MDNASTNFNTINLLKNIPKVENNDKSTNNKFHSFKHDKTIELSKKNSLLNSLNKKEKIKIKQNTTSLIHNPDNRHLNNINNISIIKEPPPQNLNENNEITIKKSKSSVKNKISKIKEQQKGRSFKDPVIAYFNRNFYCCEIPVSKKIVDNQKILDYFLKDNENKEKIKLLLRMQRSNKKIKSRNFNLRQNSYKKYDIKESLMLDDFRIFNRIHQIVRFWSRFTNYACPIFQVQKFNLNSQKYKDENKKNINSSMNNYNKNNLYDRNTKLPKLYTNSSKLFKFSETKENKFLTRNKSTIDNNIFRKLRISED